MITMSTLKRVEIIHLNTQTVHKFINNNYHKLDGPAARLAKNI